MKDRLAGYREKRRLASHMRRLVHAEPEEIGTDVSRGEFAERLVESLLAERP